MICKIIPKKCIACGLCQVKAPLFFDYDDEGIVKLINSNNNSLCLSPPIPICLFEACKKCPTRAIILEKK